MLPQFACLVAGLVLLYCGTCMSQPLCCLTVLHCIPAHSPALHFSFAVFLCPVLPCPFKLQPGQQQPRCVIPVLHNPASPGGFPGLYAFSLHEQCYLDSKTLLVTSQWYSMTVILKVELGSGAVEAVTPTDPTQGSWSLQVCQLCLCLCLCWGRKVDWT